MTEDTGFPLHIEQGDTILIRARVVLTNKYRPGSPGLEVQFGNGDLAEIPLDAAFGIITKVNGRPPQ